MPTWWCGSKCFGDRAASQTIGASPAPFEPHSFERHAPCSSSSCIPMARPASPSDAHNTPGPSGRPPPPSACAAPSGGASAGLRGGQGLVRAGCGPGPRSGRGETSDAAVYPGGDVVRELRARAGGVLVLFLERGAFASV
eukprot:3039976-Prymnesium_polylepis.2